MERTDNLVFELIASAVFGWVIGHVLLALHLGPMSFPAMLVSLPLGLPVLIVIAVLYAKFSVTVDSHYWRFASAFVVAAVLYAVLPTGLLTGFDQPNILMTAAALLAFATSAATSGIFYLLRFR